MIMSNKHNINNFVPRKLKICKKCMNHSVKGDFWKLSIDLGPGDNIQKSKTLI